MAVPVTVALESTSSKPPEPWAMPTRPPAMLAPVTVPLLMLLVTGPLLRPNKPPTAPVSPLPSVAVTTPVKLRPSARPVLLL